MARISHASAHSVVQEATRAIGNKIRSPKNVAKVTRTHSALTYVTVCPSCKGSKTQKSGWASWFTGAVIPCLYCGGTGEVRRPTRLAKAIVLITVALLALIFLLGAFGVWAHPAGESFVPMQQSIAALTLPVLDRVVSVPPAWSHEEPPGNYVPESLIAEVL